MIDDKKHERFICDMLTYIPEFSKMFEKAEQGDELLRELWVWLMENDNEYTETL